MQGKIVFEEHMAIAETLGETRNFAGDSGKWDEFERQIMDLGDERLELMDKNGIELAILSNNAPGVQAILDTKEAIEVSKKQTTPWPTPFQNIQNVMLLLLRSPCKIQMLLPRSLGAVSTRWVLRVPW